MKRSPFLFAFSFLGIIVSCNKDEPTIIDSRLVLPATIENTTSQNIPDATPTGSGGVDATPGIIESFIVIDKDGIIADDKKIFVELDLTHTYCRDIVAELFTPSGQSCGLIKRLGASTASDAGSSSDFIVGNKLTFNANNSIPIPVTSSIASGNYAPTSGSSTFPTAVSMVPLNTFFMGKNIKGTWKLKIYDYGNGDTGSLNAWKLTIEAGALK
jgi:subtilisin-like proprotein convertase family protein